MRDRLAANRILLALLALALIKSILWSVAIPPWRAPDEPQHFGYIEHLSRERSIPLWGETYLYPDILESLNRSNFGGITGAEQTDVDPQARQVNPAAQHPPLFYTLMLPAYLIASPGSVETQLYAVRIANAAIFMALIAVSYLLARRVFPNSPWMQIGVPLLMIFHPQLGFISAGAMNDTLLSFLFTLFLYQLVIFAQGDFSVRRAAAIGAVTGLGMLTKSSFLIAFPIGLAVLGVLLILRPDQRLRLLRAAAVVLAVSLPIFIWYFIRNHIELGIWQPGIMGERYGVTSWWRLLFGTSFRNDLITGYLGNFSWLSIPLPPAAIHWFTRLLEFSVIGLLAAVVMGRLRPGWESMKLWLVLLLAGVTALFFAAGVYYELTYTGTQGRYLFPAEFAISSLLLVGLTGWMPPSWRPRITAVLVAGAAVFSVWALHYQFLARVS